MAALTWMRRVRGRGGLAHLDLYTRGSLYFLLWLVVAGQVALSLTRPVRHSAVPFTLITASCLLAVAQGVCCTAFLSRALHAYLGRAAVPHRLVALSAAVMAADLAAVLALTSAVGSADAPGVPGVTLLLCAPVVPFTMGHCLIVRRRTTGLVQLALLAVVCGTVALFVSPGVLVAACLISFVCGPVWFVCATRCSAWYLGTMWKLQRAQDVQAQLAVAEERLRFGRDLHDVMGRNLAVIALKSELAVQLAERGRPEAVDQMIEVQRIARESQQGIREVVRGYRDVDLGVELDGARGVLGAAGIQCEVVGPPEGLSSAVQSALGWVVREAATNVLRHGDARRCAITVSSSASDATLTVENDGVGDCRASGSGATDRGTRSSAGRSDSGGTGQGGSGAWGTGAGSGGLPGSGLLGLRERLTAVGGSLLAGPVDGGCFRLTAEVPLATVPRPGEGAAA